MSRLVEDNITLYINYFTEQVQLVEDHCPKSRDGDLHRRILYSAILDAISRPVCVQQSNRERIVGLINKFCDWPECDRVSLSHLSQLVRTKIEPELSELRNFTIRNMSQWVRGDVVLLHRDPSFSDVERIWPQNNGKPILIDGVRLNWLQHCHLFYSYRNSLVHEFKTSGYHAELFDKNEPYYVQVTEYRDENSRELERSWQLQYTASFFKRLCKSALLSLESHLMQNQIDPVLMLAPGKYWIRELDT
jgi:hypothetical protein